MSRTEQFTIKMKGLSATDETITFSVSAPHLANKSQLQNAISGKFSAVAPNLIMFCTLVNNELVEIPDDRSLARHIRDDGFVRAVVLKSEY